MHTDTYKPNLSGLAGKDKVADSIFVHAGYGKDSDHGTRMYENSAMKMKMKNNRTYNGDY